MTNVLHVTGMRQEPRLDGVIDWSYPTEGHLEIGLKSCRFGDWLIDNQSVDEAVVNTESMFFRKNQQLVIRAGSDKYMFGLFEPIDNSYQFPFNVQFTRSRSFAGKIVLIGTVIICISLGLVILNALLQALLWLLR